MPDVIRRLINSKKIPWAELLYHNLGPAGGLIARSLVRPSSVRKQIMTVLPIELYVSPLNIVDDDHDQARCRSTADQG